MAIDIDAEIAILADAVAEAGATRDAAARSYHEARQNLHKARDRKFGLKPGKTIITHRGAEYLVTSTRHGYGDMPTLDGRRRLKSGGWHKVATSLWGKWEIVGEIPDDGGTA